MQSIQYDVVASRGIKVTGPHEFSVGGDTYNIGTAVLPLHVVMAAGVLDFSVLLYGLFDDQSVHMSIMDRTKKFLIPHWEEIKRYTFFRLPINLKKKEKWQQSQRGDKNFDIPNVVFALMILLHANGVEAIVVDPLHSGTDTNVRVVNYSEMLRGLYAKRRLGKGIKTPCRGSGIPTDDSLRLVIYQYGTGTPSIEDEQLIMDTIGTGPEEFLHCHLVPGKQAQFTTLKGRTPYNYFKESMATLLHQFSIIDEFCVRNSKLFVGQLYFKLDLFSGYAAATATACVGWGVDPATHVLAFYRGVYTPFHVGWNGGIN